MRMLRAGLALAAGVATGLAVRRRTGPRDGYRIEPYPPLWELTADSGRLGRDQMAIRALVEADVTEVRRRLADLDVDGRPASLTAYLIACLARVASTRPTSHAVRVGRRRLAVFDHVDVATMIEVADGSGGTQPLVHVLRAAEGRTVADLTRDIRQAQSAPQATPVGGRWRLVPALMALPTGLRMAAYRTALGLPGLRRRVTGSVFVTAVGMFGDRDGWGMAPGSIYPVSLLVGGLQTKPAVVDGEIVPRELLSLTFAFDEEVTAGAPAARFVKHVVNLIESGELL